MTKDKQTHLNSNGEAHPEVTIGYILIIILFILILWLIYFFSVWYSFLLMIPLSIFIAMKTYVKYVVNNFRG